MKPAKARSPALKHLRLALAVPLFLVSLLAVLRAPNYLAWELSVFVTELGWIIAFAALVVFFAGPRRSRIGRVATLLSGVAVILALSPLARAVRVARAVPGELSTAFGDTPPRSLPGAGPRSKPFVALDLLIGLHKSRVRNDSMTFTVADGKPLGLNLFRPLNYSAGALPLVVVIHGGSWRGGTRHDLDALNSYLAARGYAVAAISYRLAPQYHHPAASEDVSSAIRFLRSNASRLEIDPSRIVLIGRSAGGQLALLEAYTANDPSIRGVVALYAPSDQVFGYENPSNPHVINSTEVLENYLAGNPTTAPAAYRSASPVNFVGPSTPPTLLIHGTKDELVWVLQTARLDGRLEAAQRPHLFLRFPWATHGCDYFFNGPCGQISTYAIERFLAAVLK